METDKFSALPSATWRPKKASCWCCCSVAKSSSTLWSQGLQHARLFCPPLSPRVCSNSCPLTWWWYLIVHLILCHSRLLLPSVFPSISCCCCCFFFSNEPALHIRRGQSIGASASASVLPMSIQCWFPLGLTGWISLQSKGLSRVFSSTTVWKHQSFGVQSFCFLECEEMDIWGCTLLLSHVWEQVV